MWISNELKYMDFSDKRLITRLGLILKKFTDRPESSIPKACTSKAEIKAVYRFCSNDNVSATSIREGFRQATIDRLQQHETVLFISDATNIVYSSRTTLKGIGVLRNFKARGLSLHTTLAVLPNELSLGVINQVCWGRKDEDYGKRNERKKLPIEQKESFRWIEAFRESQSALGEKIHGIFIGDRGADIFELFIEERQQNMDLLIRSSHDRRTMNDTSKKIFKELSILPPVGTINVKIERAGKQKARIATLEIRYQNITLAPPTHKKKSGLPSININIVSATEVVDGVPVSGGIYWKLLTTLPVNCFEDASYAVKTYSTRWIIERYHYVLKQGCIVEKLQLEEASRIDKAIIIYTIVAWRIMFLTYIARVEPNSPCTKALSDDEWKALYCHANKTVNTPKDPPTISQAIFMIAKLGGFIGRKSDGNPGVKVIWGGLQSLSSIVQMYCVFTQKNSILVGNG